MGESVMDWERVDRKVKRIIIQTKKAMKITKDTKIGDIIPEGNILTGDWGYSENQIKIDFQKEEKNFEWYYNEYLDLNYNNINLILDLSKANTIYKGRFEREEYKIIPFEVKIGLFKFICDKLNSESNIKFNWLNTLELVRNWDKSRMRPKIMDICPKEFLDSIFE